MADVIKTRLETCLGGHPLRHVMAQALTAALAVLLASFGEHATAQVHAHRQQLPLGDNLAGVRPLDALPPTRLVPLQAAMAQAYPVVAANPDGSDLWPCYGRSTPNADCPTIGNPPLPLPRGAFVTGVPAYSWALRNDDIFGFGLGNGIGCDAFVNGTSGIAPDQYKACGQIGTFFEDDTNDANDDLLERVVVTQGLDVIFDSGLVDFGPAGPSVTYPVDVELYYDVNFGFWPGAGNGPNNGNCSPTLGYPLAAPTFPGIYQIATDSTCRRPKPGKARVHTETALATPTYTQATGTRCTAHNVASPCYTVSWDEKKYKIVQDWDIFLR